MSGRRTEDEFRRIVEVVLLTAERPVAVDELAALLGSESEMGAGELRDAVRRAIGELRDECESRGVELCEVASGFRYQVRAGQARWVARFLGERPGRYSRALLETLALIAYRQPVTRGEIEDVRGVGISPSIMRTLHEREWIRVVAHREAPGRPALYGTTSRFLDDFGLRSLAELPPLEQLRDVAPPDLFVAGGSGGDGESAGQGLRLVETAARDGAANGEDGGEDGTQAGREDGDGEEDGTPAGGEDGEDETQAGGEEGLRAAVGDEGGDEGGGEDGNEDGGEEGGEETGTVAAGGGGRTAPDAEDGGPDGEGAEDGIGDERRRGGAAGADEARSGELPGEDAGNAPPRREDGAV